MVNLSMIQKIGPYDVRPVRRGNEIVGFDACNGPWEWKFDEPQREEGWDGETGVDERRARIEHGSDIILGYRRDPFRWIPPKGAPRAIESIFLKFSKELSREGKVLWSAWGQPLDPYRQILSSDEWLDATNLVREVKWERGRDDRIFGREKRTGLRVFPDREYIDEASLPLGVWQRYVVRFSRQGTSLIARPPAMSSGGTGVIRMPGLKEMREAGIVSDHDMQWIQDGGQWKNVYAILGVSPTATVDEVRARYRKVAGATHPDLLLGGYINKVAQLDRALETLISESNAPAVQAAWAESNALTKDLDCRAPLLVNSLQGLGDHGVDTRAIKRVVAAAERRVRAAADLERAQKQLHETGAYHRLLEAANTRVEEILSVRSADGMTLAELAREIKRPAQDVRWFAWVYLAQYILSDSVFLGSEVVGHIRRYYAEGVVPAGLTDSDRWGELEGYCLETLKHARRGQAVIEWSLAIIANRGLKSFLRKDDATGKHLVPYFVQRMLWWTFGGDGKIRVHHVVERVNSQEGCALSVDLAAAILRVKGMELPDNAGNYELVPSLAREALEILTVFAIELAIHLRAQEAAAISVSSESLPIPVFDKPERLGDMAKRVTAYYGFDVSSSELMRLFQGAQKSPASNLEPVEVRQILEALVATGIQPRSNRRVSIHDIAVAEGVPDARVEAILKEEIAKPAVVYEPLIGLEALATKWGAKHRKVQGQPHDPWALPPGLVVAVRTKLRRVQA